MSHNRTTSEKKNIKLCYNCDEKNSSQAISVLAPYFYYSQTTFDSTEETLEPTHTDDMIHFHLSPHALKGNLSPQTLKFTGLVQNLPVMVLIRSSSLHNILQPRIAHHLHLPISPTHPFTVMVGNGAFITCQGICPSFNIAFQDTTFKIPL